MKEGGAAFMGRIQFVESKLAGSRFLAKVIAIVLMPVARLGFPSGFCRLVFRPHILCPALFGF